ncbi:MAG: TetR/AcrR family transcriptional regulator [Bacilli bacterium]|nr:TetR/AcrR family transcriptional regulator [Bacilli bacterium]
MPRTKEQNEQIKEKRKTEILDAVLDLYLTHGFDEVNVTDATREAKCSRSLFYFYIKDMDEAPKIIAEAYKDSLEKLNFFAILEKAKALGGRDGIELIIDHFVSTLNRAAKNPKEDFRFARLVLLSLFSKSENAAPLRKLSAKEPLMELIKQAQAEGKVRMNDPEDVANDILIILLCAHQNIAIGHRDNIPTRNSFLLLL